MKTKYHTLMLPRSLLICLIKNAYRAGYKQAEEDLSQRLYLTNLSAQLERAVHNATKTIRRFEKSHGIN